MPCPATQTTLVIANAITTLPPAQMGTSGACCLVERILILLPVSVPRSKDSVQKL